jgi:sugar lactone lactonase YvrE
MQKRSFTLAVAVISFALLLHSSTQPSYREEISALRREFGEATKAKDYATMQRLLLRMNDLAHGRTDMAYNLACSYALVGNKEQALHWLERFAAMGAVADAARDPDLASIASEPRFKSALARMDQNRKPVSHSSVFATLPDPDLLTEDIAFDPQTRSLLVTSVLKKKIVRVDRTGKMTDFADLSGDPSWPLFAIHFDARHNEVWATASAIPNFTGLNQADYGKTALLRLDRRTGKIVQRIAPPDSDRHSLGDMDIAANGDVIVTDSMGAAVYRLPRGATSLQRLDHGEFNSPQTPAITPNGRFAYVADYGRGIARMELTTGALEWLKHADDMALAATDGLVLHKNALYAIQNGANPVRIVKLTLKAAGDSVEKLEVLESNYPELGDPTHAVAVGNELYFIANSGWSALDDNAKLKPGEKMTSHTIRKLPLR